MLLLPQQAAQHLLPGVPLHPGHPDSATQADSSGQQIRIMAEEKKLEVSDFCLK